MVNARILLVEDEVELMRSITITLRRSGYEVVTVSQGNKALELATAGLRFDLVITDLQLPGLSGFELVNAVLTQCPGTAVGVISAYGNDRVFAELRERGCAFCLDKPFTIGDLMRCVSDALADSGDKTKTARAVVQKSAGTVAPNPTADVKPVERQ
jgi:DNA-binding NtrC family response regulator